MQHWKVGMLIGVLMGAAVLPAGCSAPRNPWTYSSPPAATMSGPALPIQPELPTVMIGRFDDPTRAPGYARGAGECISIALGRALLSRETHNVLIRPESDARGRRSEVRGHAPAALTSNVENVHFVITGKVTDFYHTADLHEDVSRWAVFGPRREAIVGIELRLVDVRTDRVLLMEKFKATAHASRNSDSDVYRDIALDSYVFWSTPLGRAARRAVEKATARVESVLPTRLGPPQIARLVDRRRVEISGGSRDGLRAGRDYYLLRQNGAGQNLGHELESEHWQLVTDAVTGQPLTVRILRLDQDSATGWLVGEPAVGQHLRGTALMSRLPTGGRAASGAVEANVAASLDAIDETGASR